ncbi:MAG: (2Fe-2S)-binding protein [Umezawaea sp.]
MAPVARDAELWGAAEWRARRRTCCQWWRAGGGYCAECVLLDSPSRAG